MQFTETIQARPPNDTVTVMIAAYNASSTIARAIKSALSEPEVAEVIVVDDASTDSTADQALAAEDGSARLKILTQKYNNGPSAARNLAVRESTSPWISILDADDFFLPGRIKNLLQFTDRADFIADDLWQVDENNVDGPRTSLMGPKLKSPRLVNFREFVLSNVTDPAHERGEMGFLKPLMRREFLQKHALSYQDKMRLGEDYELYARSLASGARLLLVPAQGYVSVIRRNSLSGQHSENDLQHLRDCDLAIEKNFSLKEEEKAALRQHYISIDCRLQWRLLINAIKNHDILAGLKTFYKPLPVRLYLLSQLKEQFTIRVQKALAK